MKTKETSYADHFIAILIIGIWGVTFISTKILIAEGLSPHEIFLLRFLIAYAGIWIFSFRRLWCDNVRDELLLFVGGMTGGSIYFLTENTALKLTMATNVSFIVCTTPLLTALLFRLFYKNDSAAPWQLWAGSLLALFGVALVVYGHSAVLKFSPLGDFLSLAAALSWAFYSLIMRQMTGRYSTIFITRKIFFYGLLTMLPVFLYRPWQFPMSRFLLPAVWGNLLFLSVVASLICFIVWNRVLKRLGVMHASNYLYLNPLFTYSASAIFLGERLTEVALVGAFFILTGVYMAEKR